MGTMVLRQSVNHLVRCDLCKKVTHSVYKVTLGSLPYQFCSGMHAEAAKANFDRNVADHKSPSIELEQTEEEGGDSLGLAE